MKIIALTDHFGMRAALLVDESWRFSGFSCTQRATQPSM
jgi:hypothetical protein